MEVELSNSLKSATPPNTTSVVTSNTASPTLTIPTSAGNPLKDYNMSNKATSMMVASMLREPAYHSRHRRSDNGDEEDDEEEDEEEEEEEEEEEIEDEDFDDIQFFHQHHRRQIILQQQQQQQQQSIKNNPGNNYLGNSSKDSSCSDDISNSFSNPSAALLNDANFNFNGSNNSSGSGDNLSQENPFAFPDNVMEYGEPQFFPGNCVGYLETILEETDEEYEEEEGCSGRHWWTADSDTDTDSVIRVAPTSSPATSVIGPNINYLNGKSKSAEEPLSIHSKSPFRTSASSRPFELEDLHLLDQLDLAFEETLMEPRRRTGFAFGHQLHLLEQPFVSEMKNAASGQKEILESLKMSLHKKDQGDKCTVSTTGVGAASSTPTNLIVGVNAQKPTMHNDNDQVQVETTQETLENSVHEPAATSKEVEGKVANKVDDCSLQNECAASVASSESSEAPAEIAEEDFFYSSPSEGSEEEEEESNHSTTEEETSSSDDSDKNGVVLAEFSLNSAGNILGNEDAAGVGAASGFNLGLYGSRHSNRRSFESQSSRLRSFRSFDSLNSLAGTELLFSKAETFPSFHYIKEVAEPGCSTDGAGGAGSGESQSLPLHHNLPHNSSEEDCFAAVSGGNKKISKKNSSSSSTSTSTSASAEGVEGMSTENLSEDSGIGAEGLGSRNLISLQKLQSNSEEFALGDSLQQQQQQPQSFTSCSSANEYIAKSEFALNPFVYSSLSDQENSISLHAVSTGNPPSCSSDLNFNNQNNNSSFESKNPDGGAEVSNPEGISTQTGNNQSECVTTEPPINTTPLMKGKGDNLSPKNMQTTTGGNTATFILGHTTDRRTNSGSSISTSDSYGTDSKNDNDDTALECGLHPQSQQQLNSNLFNAHAEDNSNKANNLPELLRVHQQSSQPSAEIPALFVEKPQSVSVALPLLLQQLFVEQQQKGTLQQPPPPDLLLPVQQCNMDIENNSSSIRSNSKKDVLLQLDNIILDCSKENKPEACVGVGVPQTQPHHNHHRNFNEISSSAGIASSQSEPSEPQLSSSSHNERSQVHDDQESYENSDNETQIVLPSAYVAFKRERSNSESEFESVESSIEEEDSQSQSMASVLNADMDEAFGDVDAAADMDTTSTAHTHDADAAAVVNINNANGKSGPMSTLGCGSVDVSYNSVTTEEAHRPSKNNSMPAIRRNMTMNGNGQQSEHEEHGYNNNSVPPPPLLLSSSSPPPSPPMETTSFLLVDGSSELPTLSTASTPTTAYNNSTHPITLAASAAENGEQPSRSVTLDESSCADVVHHHHPAAAEQTSRFFATELNNQSDSEPSGKRSTAATAATAAAAVLVSTIPLQFSGASSAQASILGSSNFGNDCEQFSDRNHQYLLELEDIHCGSGLEQVDNSSAPLGTFGAITNREDQVPAPLNQQHETVPDVLLRRRQRISTEEDQGKQAHYLPSGDSDKSDSERVNEMEIGHRRSASPPSAGILHHAAVAAATPIQLKTYGARNEVEVFLVSSRTPSPSLNPNLRLPSSTAAQQDATGEHQQRQGENEGKDPPAKVSKSRVHFSPVVSGGESTRSASNISLKYHFSSAMIPSVTANNSLEISWRESYIDQSSDFSGSSEDLLTKLEAFESESNSLLQNNNNNSGCDVEQVTTGPSNLNSSGDTEPVMTSQQQHSQAPVVVHKVQMTSSLLHGGEDEDEYEVNDPARNNCGGGRGDGDGDISAVAPVLVSMVEDEDGKRIALSPPAEEESTTDYIEFGSRHLNGGNSSAIANNLIEDEELAPEILYEDVNVQIEPIESLHHPPSNLSMVPDLLSQCENAHNSQTHIEVRIEENPVQQQQQQPPTKQILPKIFAEKGSEGKNNSTSSLTSSSSSKNKKASKGFSIQGLGSSSKKSSEKDKEKLKEKESEAAKENSGGGKTKVGFFERLSKIRLSGSSKNKNKQKIHPKGDIQPQQTIQDSQSGAGMKPPLKIKSTNTVSGNGAVNNENNKLTSPPVPPPSAVKVKSPILKKSPANSPTPIISTYNSQDMGGLDEPEPTEAFDNILEEIAGLKTIKLRQEKAAHNQQLSPKQQQHQSSRSPNHQNTRSFAERKQFYAQSSETAPCAPNGRMAELDTKLSQCKEDTTRTRDHILLSHPDLDVIEDTVRQHSVSASPEPPVQQMIPSSSEENTNNKSSPSKKSSESGQKNEREWYKLLKSAAEKYYYRGSSSSTGDLNKTKNFKTGSGIVETDLDTGASREMLDEEIVELEKVPSYMSSTPSISTAGVPSAGVIPVTSTAGVAASPGTAAKARSLTNLSSGHPLSVPSSHSHSHHHQNGELQGDLSDSDERAKSLEFLLDENNKSSSVPPENKLRQENRQLSQHELLFQRSLQKLNVPEWYKKHETDCLNTTNAEVNAENQCSGKTSLKLLKRSDYGSASGLAGGWAGLSAYKTPSLSSLQSSNGGRYSGSLNRSNFVRGRPVTMSATRSSRESLMSPSPASHSPSAFDRCSFTYGMPYSLTRFGQGRLSNHSTSISPASTPDSSILTTTTTNTYVKKPYLGWRSQERLNAAAAAASTTTPSSTGPKLSIYLPPAERLANEILAARTKNYVQNKPTGSDRPPLPKPPPRAEKTALTTTTITPAAFALHASSDPNSPPVAAEVIPLTNNQKVAHSFIRDETMKKKIAPDVHDSIREVTKAINQYVEFGEEEPPRPKPRQKSGKKPAVWIESSFVGRKPLSQ